MTRLARVVIPDILHQVTQRGNRRMETFFSDTDYRGISLRPGDQNMDYSVP